MTALLWGWFVVGVALILLRLLVLSTSDYPRVLKIRMGSDVAGLLITIGITVWVGILLFR